MKKGRSGSNEAVHVGGRVAAARAISPENIDAFFAQVGEKLREGRSGEAERLLLKTIESYDHSPDNFANLKRLLAFTLETTGRYKESLDAIQPFETEENRARLSTETQVRVIAQLAIAYNNVGDQPKAVTLLKDTLARAEENELRHLYGTIHIALARVYRRLSEYPISRDHANKALASFRETGNWLGMAEAYREIANSLHQEGNSEKAIENFQLGIKIIDGNSAPFMLGKLYTDMSGAYWFLRRPQDGIACLERSIEFFDQTEHALNSVIAYNNLGINLMLIGEWRKAEEMIGRALEIGLRGDYAHVAGIYDSLGELKLLRGEIAEAEELLERAVSYARKHHSQWYTVQSMRNLARSYLAKGDTEKAIAQARETIDFAHDVGDKHYANMAGLVLAEAYLADRGTEQCENSLRMIEESDPSADFFVLGSIQRIRGLAAADAGDVELAVHHFSRGLTIFEAGQDLYHTGLMNQLLGTHLDAKHSARAQRHLATARDIFRKLDIQPLVEVVSTEIERREAAVSKKAAPVETARSVGTQLLTVRLAEATASRELLFRELVAVLQQESNARKIIVAEFNDQKRPFPYITHGYSPPESNELCGRLADAIARNDESGFARSKGLALFQMRGSVAPPATLIVSPAAGAALADGSSLQPLISVVELGMDVIALKERDKSLPAEAEASGLASPSVMPGFIHSSPAMSALVEEIYKIRSSDVTVLVTGESGTGKELVSRAIHSISNRKDKVFVPFNCTAVPKELAEGHLFGYKKGAFTGAVADSPGTIRTADGGTLFLDEVGDLPLDVQPKLLRFLQEGEIQPLGEKRPIKVDVRIIAATNMPLEEKVADGTFREDLYYRLNVIRLRVPPLRERRAEIPPIVSYYVDHYSSRFGKHDITLTPQTVDLLMVCNWEGNVRQLCNEIQRIVARAQNGEVITPEHISSELRRNARPLTPFGSDAGPRPISSYQATFSPFTNLSGGGTLEEAVSELEMQLIRASLARHNWNISRVASELGLTRRGLYLKLSRYGINKG